jgi:N-acetylglucosamine kinase-like BadF-type ATPase
MMENFVIGIDQGGTKTMAAAADEQGNILAFGRAPGSHPVLHGASHALEQIRLAAEEAMGKAELDPQKLLALGAGINGTDFSIQFPPLSAALQKIFPVPNRVVNDCIVALRAASPGRNTMIICAGTGLNIGLLSPDGREFVFGYYIDNNHQGGTAIGHRAFVAAVQSEAGIIAETALKEEVLQHFGQPSIEKLMIKYYKGEITSGEFKELTPLVERLARAGDSAAQNIAAEFATGCIRYVKAGVYRFGMETSDLDIYLSGGVFKNKTFADLLTTALLESFPGAKVADAYYEPVVGSVRIALETAFGDISADAEKNLRRTAEQLGLIRSAG